MNEKMMAAAMEFSTHGLSSIPTKADKSPAIEKWTPYQKRHMTPKEINSHFRNGHGIGIICGAISGNTECLDVDKPEFYQPFMEILGQQKPKLASILVKEKTLTPGCRHLIYRQGKT